MKKVLLILLLGTQVVLWGHLCNDVFMQAVNRLAVKVDTRDGQLRINQAGTFRVFVQNSTDYNIENIGLRVRAKGFKAKVRPSRRWVLFPTLINTLNGGGTEYFEVTLTRKPGVSQGKHKLQMYLTCSGRALKRCDIGIPAEKMVIPGKSPTLQIDGNVNAVEWGNTKLCTSFYEIRKRKKKNSSIQTRVRFSHDQQALYCLVDFQKKGNLDQVNLYISKNESAEPVKVSIDLQSANVSCSPQSPGNERIQAAIHPESTKVEIRLPFKLLQLSGQSYFLLNMTRKQDDRMTYWRGEVKNISDPSVFEKFELQ
jgi:hypothetical protein